MEASRRPAFLWWYKKYEALPMSLGGRVHQCLAHGLVLARRAHSACVMFEPSGKSGSRKTRAQSAAWEYEIPIHVRAESYGLTSLLPALTLRIWRGCFTCAAGCSHRRRQCLPIMPLSVASASGHPLLAPGHPRACPLEVARLLGVHGVHIGVSLCKHLSHLRASRLLFLSRNAPTPVCTEAISDACK